MNNIATQIYRFLLSRIHSGEIVCGSLLPTELDLALQFCTNRMNARTAVNKLASEGLVLRRRRIGTSLRSPVDMNLVSSLIKEVNHLIYILYSATPHWIHWNNSSFVALEKEVGLAGYSVVYDHIPFPCQRQDYIDLLGKISAAGASALVIFPDTKDNKFLKDNGDLLLDFQMPVYMLNRGGELMDLDMVSFLSMDPLGDGINVGTLLSRSGCQNIVMLNEGTGKYFWGKKRYEGLLIGLRRGTLSIPTPENILANEEGFARIYSKIQECKGSLVVVAVNNQYAAEFIDTMKKQDVFVQKDYQLITFDDNPLYRSYNLTSMATPMEKIGKLFGMLICDKSWLQDFRGKVSIRINSELVVRETFKLEN